MQHPSVIIVFFDPFVVGGSFCHYWMAKCLGMTGTVGGEEWVTVGVVAIVSALAPRPPQHVNLYHCKFHISGGFQSVVKQIHFILTPQHVQGPKCLAVHNCCS